MSPEGDRYKNNDVVENYLVLVSAVCNAWDISSTAILMLLVNYHGGFYCGYRRG